MSNSVGRINLDLGINTTGFKKELTGITKTAKSSVSSMSSMFSKLGPIIAAAFSIKAIVDFSKECLKLGSDLQEVQNVVDVTFGSMSDKVNNFAKNAITSFGLSEKVAKDYMGQFGAMSKAFGNTEQMAYKQAEALTGLAGDVASFYNMTTDEAFTKLKSVYSGETETLKSLGVVMTQAALDEYAFQQGLSKTTKDMSEQEKVALRLSFVQDRLSGAAGDFARTSGSWANQTRILSLRFDALKASIGQGLISALTPVIQVINDIIAHLQVAADAFKNFMEAIFGNSSESSAIGSMAGASDIIAGNMGDTATSAAKVKKSLAGFDKLNILSSPKDTSESSNAANIPNVGSKAPDKSDSKETNKYVGLIDDIKKKLIEITKITGLDTMWDKFKSGAQSVKNGTLNVFDNLKTGINNAKPKLEKFKNSLINTFTSGSNTVTLIWGGMVNTLGTKWEEWTLENGPKIEEFFTNTSNTIADIGTLISDAWGDIFTSLSNWWEADGLRIFGGINDAIGDVGKWLLDLWNDFILPVVNSITDIAKRLWDNHLKPLWDDILEFFTSVGDFLLMLWNKRVKPVVDWFIENMLPVIKNGIDFILNILGTLFGFIIDGIRNTLKWLSGILDFITGVFTGNWEKAWMGVKKIFESVWNSIKNVFKTVVNLIIDLINGLIGGVYTGVRAIVNTVGKIADKIGDLFGQDWGWEMPKEPPKIPHLATGGYVAANTPQLAIVGDNRREGEIIAPESKIAEAVARGFAMVMAKIQTNSGPQNDRPIYLTLKLGEDDFWRGFVDYHNSVVKRTGNSPLLV